MLSPKRERTLPAGLRAPRGSTAADPAAHGAADLDARDATGCGVAEHVGDRVERAARLQYDSDRPSAGAGSVGDFANYAFRRIAAERHRMRLEKTRDVTDQPRRGQACALQRGRDLIGLEEAVAIGGPVVDQRVEQRMSEPGKGRAAVGPDSLMRVRACGEEAKADRRATREIQLPPSGRNEPACDELAHAAAAVQAHRRIETQGIAGWTLFRRPVRRNFVYNFSRMVRFLTAGESHGRALIVILEGIPAGLSLDLDAITRDLRAARGATGAAGGW